MARSSTWCVRRIGYLCGCLSLLAACRGGPEAADTKPATKIEVPTCPTQQLRETRAPDVRPEHEHAEYWLRTTELAGLDHDAELLDEAARSMLAARVAELPGGWRDPTRPEVGDPALIDEELNERLAWLRERVASGAYVETSAGALERAAARIEAAAAIEGPLLRFVVSETPLWCVPTLEGLYTDPVDLDFDRNRCASLHPGELVAAMRSTNDGAWVYVDAGHSVGWVEQTDGPTLGPALTAEDAKAQLDATPRARMLGDFEHLRAGSSFALLGRDEDGHVTLAVPGNDGTIERELPPDAPVHEGALGFSRRAVFTQAFALLEQPYGWGGRDGHRDCSSYLLDLFAQFDVRLPRNSAVQAQMGTRSVDLSALPETEKLAAIREAAREGVVLLYMPGHILLYLGRDGEHDYGISALSEFLTPCEGGSDTVHRLDKVAVTTLALGRGTQRKSFIERITRMAVFGPLPN